MTVAVMVVVKAGEEEKKSNQNLLNPNIPILWSLLMWMIKFIFAYNVSFIDSSSIRLAPETQIEKCIFILCFAGINTCEKNRRRGFEVNRNYNQTHAHTYTHHDNKTVNMCVL